MDEGGFCQTWVTWRTSLGQKMALCVAEKRIVETVKRTDRKSERGMVSNILLERVKRGVAKTFGS